MTRLLLAAESLGKKLSPLAVRDEDIDYVVSSAVEPHPHIPRLSATQKSPKAAAPSDLGALFEAMKSIPWTTLQQLKGDVTLIKKIEEAESTLQSLRKALT